MVCWSVQFSPTDKIKTCLQELWESDHKQVANEIKNLFNREKP